MTGSLLKVHRDEVLLPGKKSAREWIDHPGAAAVIPVLPRDRVVLVRQFRYPIGRRRWRYPPGSWIRGNHLRNAPRGRWRKKPVFTSTPCRILALS